MGMTALAAGMRADRGVRSYNCGGGATAGCLRWGEKHGKLSQRR